MINKELHTSLIRAVQSGVLPGKEVKIANENMPMACSYQPDPTYSDGRHIRTTVLTRGEYYRVCCPMCGDNRYRLYISYRWGVYDENNHSTNRYLLHCYNEECERLYDNFITDLEQALKGYVQRAKGKFVTLEEVPEQPAERIVRVPGACTRVDQLTADHPANKFLISRGYDPELVGPEYGISYCGTSKMAFARDRIVIPAYTNGKLMTWQARYVDSNGNGDVSKLFWCTRCFSTQRIPEATNKSPSCTHCGGETLPVPKYFTCSGTLKSHALFNRDGAWRQNFVVVCEGPMDVMRLGTPTETGKAGPGVAVFGHTLSPMQMREISSRFRNGAIVLLFDGDIFKDEKNVERVQQLQSDLKAMVTNVVTIRLREDLDPGDMEHGELWREILRQAEQAGVDLRKHM